MCHVKPFSQILLGVRTTLVCEMYQSPNPTKIAVWPCETRQTFGQNVDSSFALHGKVHLL